MSRQLGYLFVVCILGLGIVLPDRALSQETRPDVLDPPAVSGAAAEESGSHGPPSLEHRHATVGEPGDAEWIGRGLPWWQWSHLTGNWNDWRTQFRNHGLVVEGSWLVDISKVESGGVRRQTTTRSLLHVDATLDLEPILAIPNATLGIQFYSQVGPDGSAVAGDIQAYDNIDTKNTQQLAEFWYEQLLFDEKLRLRLGKFDANSEFAFVESGGEFLNSSMGFGPSIVGFPSYPDPATGAVLFAKGCDCAEIGIGVFDGAAQEGERLGRKGVGTFFGDPSDLFLISEGRLSWELPFQSLGGRLALGVWHHTGTFARFNGGPDSGTEGYYLILEQNLWKPGGSTASDEGEDPRGIAAFLQFGVADEAVSEIKRHMGGGVRWRGPIASRPYDVVGLGVSHVELSDRPGSGFTESSEVAHEIFYLAQITPWLFVQPDVQYITDPGGNANVDDVVVVTVRVGLLF